MKTWLWGLLLLPLVLWGVSLPGELWIEPQGFWVWRKESIYLFGVIAYVFMAWSVMLSARWPWLERRLGGLDRVYRQHKWSGIWAGVFLFLHWMAEIIPKSLSKAGVSFIPPRVKKAGGESAEGLMHTLTDLAKDLGEWVAYGALVLIAIALIKLIPYHWFRKVHKVFPVLFLAITFHSVMLMRDGMWLTPAGMVFAVIACVGTVAALIGLFQRIGAARKITGRVREIVRHANEMIEVRCALDGPGLLYRSGQFSFVHFACSGEAHPFSMVSAAGTAHDAAFMIKPLGDDTRRIVHLLREGDGVTLEGPYGGFDFAAAEGAEQIWVGGGVGITPFLSRLRTLSERQEAVTAAPMPIHFFYCAPDQPEVFKRLIELCERAGVLLHWIDREKDGALTFDRISEVLQTPAQASLWFCGPAGLGDVLEAGWLQRGFQAARFHREFFEFR